MADTDDRPETVVLKVKRQGHKDEPARWEEFEVPWEEHLNVHAALMAVQRKPVTREGRKTTPVVWDSACLEEVCGSCTMIINGQVRQACAAMVDELEQPIELRPMEKFPLIRDLAVDRTRIFADFGRVHAWIHLDGTHDLGPGPRLAPELAELRYALSRCMACGCCLEACPNYGPQSDYVGAAVVNQVRLFNLHPSGKMHADERLDTLLEPGGIGDCGNSQNCVEVCPKEIPLTDSLAETMRATTWRGIKKLIK
jgi:succinate dehydrogenase / fumarate reductase iron-sulfur subunit